MFIFTISIRRKDEEKKTLLYSFLFFLQIHVVLKVKFFSTFFLYCISLIKEIIEWSDTYTNYDLFYVSSTASNAKNLHFNTAERK
jgi:hypothetical protein